MVRAGQRAALQDLRAGVASIGICWPISCGGFWRTGANSSFVNQVLDGGVPPETVARDPFEALDGAEAKAVVAPARLFGAGRERFARLRSDLSGGPGRDRGRARPLRRGTWKAGRSMAPAVMGGEHGR